MASYRDHVAQYIAVADDVLIPRFSALCRTALIKLFSEKQAVELIEAVTRIGDYGNYKEQTLMRQAVSRLRCVDGDNPPRGKRVRPGMLELVDDLTPILLYYGLPRATSGRSRLVLALQTIADEIGLQGDPRDELRRLSKKSKSYDREIKVKIIEAVKKGLASLKITTPPEYPPP